MPDTAISPDEISREAWLALFVSTVVVFLVVIDISAVNVAFPSIREDFGVTSSELSWIVSGYNIVVGALLMVSGRLADSLGRRKVYLPGVAIFGIGSALCAMAPSASLLIFFRLIQAVGGAITTAAGFAVMLPEFPSAKRSTAIGIAGATGALGAVVGPAIGSLLIDLFSWQAIFWLNVPLCMLVLVIGPKFLNESSDPEATGKIDLLGVILGTTAVALIMFATVQSEKWGLTDIRFIVMLLVGLALLPAMIQRSRTHPEPLIKLELYDYQSFRSANIGVSLWGLGFASGFLVNSLMLQDVWDLPIRSVGLALVPAPLLAAAVSVATGRYADRYGHRWLLGIGCSFCGIGYLLQGLLLTSTPAVWTIFVPLSLIGGVGVGLTVATWSSAGIADIPEQFFGVAGATYNTVRQASYAMGISVSIALIAWGSSAEADGLANTRGIRWAWFFVAGAYLASAVAVVKTFPAGSSADRAEAQVEAS